MSYQLDDIPIVGLDTNIGTKYVSDKDAGETLVVPVGLEPTTARYSDR